ncbi:MAG: hypothetical protein COB46_01070 [Rhodospirillaceae bacterium]|nr:MAG: hypothetical protein COB46_01070 [Rhodospirillaceae bacterium]
MSDTTTPQPDWSRVTAIVVTHHGAAVIGDCLKSFVDVPNIIVVDNASDDDTLDIVRAMTPHARIVENAIGVGYGNAANQALELVETEFAITVNPDSIVLGDAVAALLKVADEFPDASIVCPQNINLDGSLELTHDAAMAVRSDFLPPYHRRDQEPAPQGNVCADFISGAVNLIRMSVIHKIGGFDKNILLYFEDDDLCVRMRAAGYSLILTPYAEIMHINAGSVRPSLHYKWEKFWNYGWARLYIEKKRYGMLAMLKIAGHHFFKFLIKTLVDVLTFRFDKALRDAAKFSGTVSFLIGIRAIKPKWKALNERVRRSTTD